jgi:fused signal recognition particle receptor
VVFLVILLIAVPVVVAGTAYLFLRDRPPRGDVDPPLAPGTTLLEAPPTDTEVAAAPIEAPPVVEAPPVEEVAVVEPLVRPRFRDRLGKARGAISGYLTSIAGRSTVDQDTWDELEEALILADAGIGPTTELLDAVRAKAKAAALTAPGEVLELLRSEMKERLVGDRTLDLRDGATNVWLFVGVNGVGKTTSIGKVAARLGADGHHVLMAAGDTFRAAAAEQLATWAERTGAEFVRGEEGGDPGAVIFDGIQAGAARGCDVILADTAGRLHTKTNLMEELQKVRRVAERDPGTVTEVLLVIDATIGQNGLTQAKQFADAVDVTGVVLTKLDGSAKGGVVFAIETQLGLPVKLVGLGESVGDLVDFDPDEFVDGLFAVEE